MSAELGRVERMSEFETEVLASGFFHVLEEIVPPTVADAPLWARCGSVWPRRAAGLTPRGTPR
jgi:hypothetical protein